MMTKPSFNVGDAVITTSYPLNKRVERISHVKECKLYDTKGEYAYSIYLYKLHDWVSSHTWFRKDELRKAFDYEIINGTRSDSLYGLFFIAYYFKTYYNTF